MQHKPATIRALTQAVSLAGLLTFHRRSLCTACAHGENWRCTFSRRVADACRASFLFAVVVMLSSKLSNELSKITQEGSK